VRARVHTRRTTCSHCRSGGPAAGPARQTKHGFFVLLCFLFIFSRRGDRRIQCYGRTHRQATQILLRARCPPRPRPPDYPTTGSFVSCAFSKGTRTRISDRSEFDVRAPKRRTTDRGPGTPNRFRNAEYLQRTLSKYPKCREPMRF